MGLKKISTLIVIILMISICIEAGASSSVELQDDADLQDGENNDLADSAWPKYRGDKRNTGRSPYDTSHVDGGIEWVHRALGDHIMSEPVILSNGTILIEEGYFSTFSPARLIALNQTGTEEWNFTKANSKITTTPAVGSDRTIYSSIVEDEHDKEDGERIAHLYALYPNGTKKWSYTLDHPIWSSPAIGDDGTIYFSCDEELYAIHPNGTERWNVKLGGDINTTPAIDDNGNLYVGTSGKGELYLIDPKGNKENIYQTEGGGFGTPAISEDGTIYVGSTEGSLFAFESDGRMKWEYRKEETESTSALSSLAIGNEGTIYFSSHHLYAINPDGSEKWVHNFTDARVGTNSPLIGGDETIYVGSFGENLYAISPDGEKEWDLTLDNPFWRYFSGSIDKNGTLYITGKGRLYALGERERPDPPDFTKIFTAFIADNWCFISLFVIVAIPVIYKIIKSRKSSSTPPRENPFEEDGMEEYKEER